MILSNLVHHLDAATATGALDREVRRVVLDPAEAGPDDLLVLPRDSGRLVQEAADTRAAAVLTDTEVEVDDDVTVITVRDARRALAQASAALYGHPGRRIPVIGITGTAGKTTVSLFLEVIAQRAGRRAGILTPAGRRLPCVAVAPDGPALEAPQVQWHLREMVDEGCALAVLEARSVDLSLGRLDRTELRVAAFTGFGAGPLGFHGTMQAYLAAKLRMFSSVLRRDGTAIIAGRDPHGVRFVEAAGRRTVWRYGQVRPGEDASDLEIAATDVVLGAEGAACHLTTPRGEGDLLLHTVGAHNLDDALAAIGCALAVGIPLQTCLDALAELTGLPERMERIDDPDDQRTVLVDLARTPHALAKAIEAARSLRPRKLYLVFGCGPDLDRSLRPGLGQVASVGASRAWLTRVDPSQDPSENVESDVLQGVPHFAADDVTVEPDPARAIEQAIDHAGPEDVVLIAGVGVEASEAEGGWSARQAAADVLETSLPELTSGLFEQL